MDNSLKQTKILSQSALATLLAIVVWFIVYTIVYIIFGSLDSLRGLSNNWLQKIFRELITPFIGGCAAIFVIQSWLPHAHLKFVLWTFSILVFLFMIGLPVFIILFLSKDLTFSWTEQMIRWLGGGATILGAFLAHKQILEK